MENHHHNRDEVAVKEVLDSLIDVIDSNYVAEVNNNPSERTKNTNGLAKDISINSNNNNNNNKDNKVGEFLYQQQNEKFQKIPCPITNQEQSINNSEQLTLAENKSFETQQIQAISKKPKIEDVTLNKTTTLDKPKAELTIVGSNDIIETDETKDMAVLRNLEISPSPQSPIISAQQPQTMQLQEKNEERNKELNSNDEKETFVVDKTPSKNAPTKKYNKRKLSQSGTPDPSNNEESASARSKRQRTQTKLFQAGEPKPTMNDPFGSSSDHSPTSPIKTNRQSRTANKGRKKSNTSSNCSEANLSYNAQDTVQERPNPITNDPQDVIFYEKNDYLAIRNEENTFYLCQLTQNVRSDRTMIRVKWLDTNDDGKTYFLTAHYDKVPHKSIIMPVSLNKLKSEKKGEQIFNLEDQDRENIMDRLKRSVIASQHNSLESGITE